MKMSDGMYIPVAPVSKPRMTQRDRWAKRSCVERYWSFKDIVKSAMDVWDFTPSDMLHIVFYVPMPKSWTGRKYSEMLGKPHKQKPDIDNFVKGLLDAMLVDDAGIHTVFATKIWSIHGGVQIKNMTHEERDILLRAAGKADGSSSVRLDEHILACSSGEE
jgi:Holliday junction resolvase RusA-like endonuclease